MNGNIRKIIISEFFTLNDLNFQWLRKKYGNCRNVLVKCGDKPKNI